MAILILLAMLLVTVGGSLLTLRWLVGARRPPGMPVVAVAIACWGAAYAILLANASISSTERTLALGDTYRLCGAYLDCHLGVAVRDVRRARVLGTPARQATAGGWFWVVTVQVNSDARRATLALVEPELTVVDARGRAYRRSAAGERALAGDSVLPPLSQPVDAGAAFTSRVVFDLPADVSRPRLLVRQGSRQERAAELVLIGHDHSLGHAHTYLAMDAERLVRR
ncbi:MAG TPA: hypothetical protein VHQ45_03810 [Gemmatimonadaceae bacterium]|nr:hypothetical protein [Gemmatimonadaceae bacterium]